MSLTVWHNQQKKKTNKIQPETLKNNLTIAVGGGTVGRGDYRNYYKGHMDKIKGEGGGGGGRWVQLGWGGGMGRKGIQL